MCNFILDVFALSNSSMTFTLVETGIAFPKPGSKFAKSATSSSTQWINPENGKRLLLCWEELYLRYIEVMGREYAFGL